MLWQTDWYAAMLLLIISVYVTFQAQAEESDEVTDNSPDVVHIWGVGGGGFETNFLSPKNIHVNGDRIFYFFFPHDNGLTFSFDGNKATFRHAHNCGKEVTLTSPSVAYLKQDKKKVLVVAGKNVLYTLGLTFADTELQRQSTMKEGVPQDAVSSLALDFFSVLSFMKKEHLNENLLHAVSEEMVKRVTAELLSEVSPAIRRGKIEVNFSPPLGPFFEEPLIIFFSGKEAVIQHQHGRRHIRYIDTGTGGFSHLHSGEQLIQVAIGEGILYLNRDWITIADTATDNGFIIAGTTGDPVSQLIAESYKVLKFLNEHFESRPQFRHAVEAACIKKIIEAMIAVIAHSL